MHSRQVLIGLVVALIAAAAAGFAVVRSLETRRFRAASTRQAGDGGGTI